MKPKIFSLILVLAMLTGLFPAINITAAAADNVVITFRATTGSTLTQEMVNEQIAAVEVGEYGSFSAAFDSNVESIGDMAFCEREGLTSVTVGTSVTSVGDYAFFFCENLSEVVIKDRVKTIGIQAFSYCRSLERVLIPDSVTSIGESAFSACVGLKEINVTPGNSVYSSEDGVLFEKDKTVLIQYPPQKTDTAYIIPDSVMLICNSAFSGCTNIEGVTIGAGVTSIGDSAFSECTSLLTVEIPDNVQSIGHSAFSSCTDLMSVIIGNKVTSISDFVFSWCSSLADITIGENVASIGEYAFFGCERLTSVVIPDSVTSIYNAAFYDCMNLESVLIPDSVTFIFEEGDGEILYSSVFDNCPLLTIFSPAQSYAHTYAIRNNIRWKDSYLFPGATYLVTVNAGSGGTVIGSGEYNGGELVTITAIPGDGYVFDGWYEDYVKIDDADATYNFIITSDRTLDARFIEASVGSDPVVKVSSASGKAGSEVTLAVTLEDNPGIAFFALTMKYDKTKLTYVSSAVGDIVSQNFTALDYGDQVTFSAYTSNGLDVTAGTALFMITFKIKDGTEGGIIDGLTLGYFDMFDGFVSDDNYVNYNISTQGAITVESDDMLESIAVTAMPAKTVYTEGDALDLTGMVVTATYSKGEPKAITGYTTTPADGTALAADDKTVTVSYTEDGVTQTASFDITVEIKLPTTSLDIQLLTTSKILEKCAANIKVKVTPEGFTPDKPIVVTLKGEDGTVYGTATADSDGIALVKASAFPSADTYTFIAACGDITGSLDLNVVPYDLSIWDVYVSLAPDEKNTMLTFGETPVPKDGTFDGQVSVNGVIVQTGTSITGNSVVIPYEFDKLNPGDKIVVSGVKYPDLFPSYSFTFTIEAK